MCSTCKVCYRHFYSNCSPRLCLMWITRVISHIYSFFLSQSILVILKRKMAHFSFRTEKSGVAHRLSGQCPVLVNVKAFITFNVLQRSLNEHATLAQLPFALHNLSELQIRCPSLWNWKLFSCAILLCRKNSLFMCVPIGWFHFQLFLILLSGAAGCSGIICIV